MGCLCAGLGVGLAGVASAYGAVMAAVVLSGLGIAAYHPEAARNAHAVSGGRRATGMSIYSVGGNLGFALGTLAITPFLLRFGRAGALGMVPSVAITALLLWRALPRIAPSAQRAIRAGAVRIPAMVLLLLAVVALRSSAQMGFATFLPLWYSAQHRPLADSSGVVFVFLIAGAAGTLVGGPLADRFGRKPVILSALLLMPPLLLAALHVRGWIAWPLLLLAGAATVSSFVVTLVMAQDLMPYSTGTAAGLMVGFAIGIGGLGVGALGHFADAFGQEATLTLVALLPLPAAACAAWLRDAPAGAVTDRGTPSAPGGRSASQTTGR